MKIFLKIALVALALALVLFSVSCGCDDDDDDDDDDSSAQDDDDSVDDDDSADDDDDDDVTGDTFRIAVISDPEIVQDNLMGWNNFLDQVIVAINAETDIDFVLILGDLAIWFYNPIWDSPWSKDSDKSWSDSVELALEALNNLTVPYYFIPGEKDYFDELSYYQFHVEWADRAERTTQLHNLLQDAYPGDGLWYTFTHKGLKFFGANTMAGDAWQNGFGLTGSFGQDQIDAIETEINSGGPSIILTHHSALATLDGIEDPDGGQSLKDILEAKAHNVIALFNGHHHSYKEYDFAGVSGFNFGAVSKAGKHYAIVEIDPVAGTVTVVNKEDLPYPPDYVNFSCEPGVDTVGELDGLVDTIHALFISQLGMDNFFLDMLLAGANLDDMPVPFWLMEETAGGYNAMVTLGMLDFGYYSGDHAVTVYTPAPDCVMADFQYDDPCLSAANVQWSWDLLPIIDPSFGEHIDCGVQLIYEAEVDFELKMGLDEDDNMSIAAGQVSMDLEKQAFIDMLEKLIVDSYCAYDCVGGFPPEPISLMTPEDGCDAVENGDQAACDAGTLTFADVPAMCDTLIGDEVKISVRLVLPLMEVLLDETSTVNFKFKGWGHEMVLVDDWYDLSQDWSMLDWVWDSCPQQPTK